MKQNALFIALILQIIAYSQVDTLYFNEHYNRVNKSEMKYYRIIKKDSIEKNLVKIIDYRSGDLIYAIGYSKLKNYPKHWHYKNEKTYTLFYENGNKKEENKYSKGECLFTKNYFKNGKIYKIVNNDDEFVDAVFDSLGVQLVFNGNGKSKEFCEDFEGAIEEGIYREGVKDSIWVARYKNGNIYYIENYKKGNLKAGTSYDSLKNEAKYTEIYEMGEFKGGNSALSNFLSRNLKYPEFAINNYIEGVVYVKFCVDARGKATDFSLMNPVNFLLDNEALRVVKLTDGKWKPRLRRGIPIDTYFNIPITFELTE